MNDVNEDGAWRWTEDDGDDKMTSKNIPATIVIIDLFDGSVVVVATLIFIVAYYLSSNNPLLMQERRKDEGLLYRVLV